MKKEKIVKTHTRKTKSGKTVTVRQHTAKYDAAEEAKKMAQKAGSGKEFESKSKEYKVTKDDLDTLGMSMKELDSLAKKLGVSHSDAASWYSGSDFSNFSKSGSVRADKAARKVVGEDAYKKHKGSQNLVDMVMSGTGARPGKTLQKRGASNEKTGTITRKEISDLDSSIGKIRKSAKVLGLTEREAASWVEGPNWCSYNEKHLNKGNRAAKKFLGSEWYNKLDKTGSAIPQAVLHKIKGGTYDQKSEKKNELSVKDKSFKKLNKKQLSADDKKRVVSQ